MNKRIITIGIGTAFTGVVLINLYLKRRTNNMIGIHDDLAKINTNETKEMCKVDNLSPFEKEKLTDTIKGMSEEEMRIVLQNIPIDLVFDHIKSVMEMHRQFAQSIQSSFDILGGING